MNMLSDKMQKLPTVRQERQNLEVQKLYEREKVNPMSDCLWTMVPILFCSPRIIRQPMTTS